MFQGREIVRIFYHFGFEERLAKVKLAPNDTPKGETDWERVDSMTEEEINAAALSDPDAQPLTEEELSQFRRVPDA